MNETIKKENRGEKEPLEGWTGFVSMVIGLPLLTALVVFLILLSVAGDSHGAGALVVPIAAFGLGVPYGLTFAFLIGWRMLRKKEYSDLLSIYLGGAVFLILLIWLLIRFNVI